MTMRKPKCTNLIETTNSFAREECLVVIPKDIMERQMKMRMNLINKEMMVEDDVDEDWNIDFYELKKADPDNWQAEYSKDVMKYWYYCDKDTIDLFEEGERGYEKREELEERLKKWWDENPNEYGWSDFNKLIDECLSWYVEKKFMKQ
jgi:hypothetical protein